MKSYRNKGTKETPEVILDSSEDYFEINGASLMDDAVGFYRPILDWIEEYKKYPNEETNVNLIMSYFNTASSKMLLDVLNAFEEIAEEGHNVTIRWHYEENDRDMMDAGEKYAEMVELTFEFYSYQGE